MNEKELEAMMESEKPDLDKLKKEIEELEAEIDRMLESLNEVSPEEKEIMEKIRQVLDEHNLKYTYDENEPKHVELGFSMDNKPFKIHIILQSGKIIFRLSFPLRVQANAFPLMCMFMAKFNENMAFADLHLDRSDGELTMEYSSMLEDPAQVVEKYFWIYMTSLIHPALEIYTKVVHLSVGMVSGKEKEYYRKLLEMALETINGDYKDENVCYGTASLEAKSISDFSDLLGKDSGEEEKEDDSDSDDENMAFGAMHSLRRRRISGFEELMRMKAQEEESDEDEPEDQTIDFASMLTMFDRRDEDGGYEVIGGNDDE